MTPVPHYGLAHPGSPPLPLAMVCLTLVPLAMAWLTLVLLPCTTLSLGSPRFSSPQLFQVAYVLIKMGNSPRPGVWVLERSVDNGETYTPWQYFADSPGWVVVGREA